MMARHIEYLYVNVPLIESELQSEDSVILKVSMGAL
jgi:hypothetical protein